VPNFVSQRFAASTAASPLAAFCLSWFAQSNDCCFWSIRQESVIDWGHIRPENVMERGYIRQESVIASVDIRQKNVKRSFRK